MADLVELFVAGIGAVAANLVVLTIAAQCVALVPVARGALDAAHEALCRIVGIVGGGYGLVGHARPRRRRAPLS